ncbi:hypothetical protein BB560_002854 [Smittium megazygosporum]|uniref:Uncharacterized protein n=1 Tax=Smittium megazygosporum TaxID=133381 RepID=A0A2T9ZDR9_9FUNG|nr:hypothetical protein BB560_002854 [Smittium megazygosporum]
MWYTYTNLFNAPHENNCNELPSAAGIRLSVLMIIATYFSYLPQQIKIFKLKSSYGISPYFILLGSLGAVSNALNITLLNYWIFDCCSIISTNSCLIKLLVDKKFISSQVSHSETIIQSNSETSPLLGDSNTNSQQNSNSRDLFGLFGSHYTQEYQTTLLVLYSIILYFFVCIAVSVIFTLFTGPYSFYTTLWGKLLGVFSLFVTLVQFIPQIVKTYSLKEPGSLSIPMMVMQSPGGFLFAYILASQPNSSWTSWISTFFAASFQMVLLFLCLYYVRKPSSVSISTETEE